MFILQNDLIDDALAAGPSCSAYQGVVSIDAASHSALLYQMLCLQSNASFLDHNPDAN